MILNNSRTRLITNDPPAEKPKSKHHAEADRQAFHELIKNTSEDLKPGIDFDEEALDTIQEICEGYVIDVLQTYGYLLSLIDDYDSLPS